MLAHPSILLKSSNIMSFPEVDERWLRISIKLIKTKKDSGIAIYIRIVVTLTTVNRNIRMPATTKSKVGFNMIVNKLDIHVETMSNTLDTTPKYFSFCKR